MTPSPKPKMSFTDRVLQFEDWTHDKGFIGFLLFIYAMSGFSLIFACAIVGIPVFLIMLAQAIFHAIGGCS